MAKKYKKNKILLGLFIVSSFIFTLTLFLIFIEVIKRYYIEILVVTGSITAISLLLGIGSFKFLVNRVKNKVN